MKRRSEREILDLVAARVEDDPNVRAVILNGSRANPAAVSDDFQDYDLLFVVTDLHPYRAEPAWIDTFGERLLLQTPNTMRVYPGDSGSDDGAITYLMLFRDHNRIDLTLTTADRASSYLDRPYAVLHDKDDRFADPGGFIIRDHRISAPTQRQFTECCNEFWWVAPYVVKGLARGELLYANRMLEGPIRTMALRMLGWLAGTEAGFPIDLGREYRHLHRHLPPRIWNDFLTTFPTADARAIRPALLTLAELFDATARTVSSRLHLNYNSAEAVNAREYLEHE